VDIHCRMVVRPTRHKTGHFGAVLPSSQRATAHGAAASNRESLLAPCPVHTARRDATRQSCRVGWGGVNGALHCQSVVDVTAMSDDFTRRSPRHGNCSARRRNTTPKSASWRFLPPGFNCAHSTIDRESGFY